MIHRRDIEYFPASEGTGFHQNLGVGWPLSVVGHKTPSNPHHKHRITGTTVLQMTSIDWYDFHQYRVWPISAAHHSMSPGYAVRRAFMFQGPSNLLVYFCSD